MSLIIGLTGGIGCGKSTVSAFFSALNITVVDADIIARLVVKKGEPVLQQIKKQFGSDILMNGELNRHRLRDIIFKDELQKEWLNRLLHPLIHSQIIKQLAQAKGDYILLEAPLLFENGLDKLTDYNLLIDIEPELQIKRATERDRVSKENIKAIISSQMSRHLRLQKADFVINNSELSLSELESAVMKLDLKFKEMVNI